jgi:hypothetical protein
MCFARYILHRWQKYMIHIKNLSALAGRPCHAQENTSPPHYSASTFTHSTMTREGGGVTFGRDWGH